MNNSCDATLHKASHSFLEATYFGFRGKTEEAMPVLVFTVHKINWYAPLLVCILIYDTYLEGKCKKVGLQSPVLLMNRIDLN